MTIHIDEENLKSGVLGLVIALVEIIRDALNTQALRRLESGVLTDDECERLGKALMELDIALEEIKDEQGITELVRSAREELDKIVGDVMNLLIDPEKCQWETEAGRKMNQPEPGNRRERIDLVKAWHGESSDPGDD